MKSQSKRQSSCDQPRCTGFFRHGFDDGGKDFATGRRWVWSTEDSSRQRQRRENCKKGAGGKMAEKWRKQPASRSVQLAFGHLAVNNWEILEAFSWLENRST